MSDGYYPHKIIRGAVFDYASMPEFLVQSTWTAANHDFWYVVHSYPRLARDTIELLVINKVIRRVA